MDKYVQVPYVPTENQAGGNRNKRNKRKLQNLTGSLSSGLIWHLHPRLEEAGRICILRSKKVQRSIWPAERDPSSGTQTENFVITSWTGNKWGVPRPK